MKKLLTVTLALCLCLASMMTGTAEDALLPQLEGTYIELFPEFAKEEYKDYWMECIGAYTDDAEAAKLYYEILTMTCQGELKGQAAIDAYSADPASMKFDCFFENNVKKITIKGNEISGTDPEGNELFRHSYTYLEEKPITYMGEDIGLNMHAYKTEDADAGIFTYFLFADDTIATTQHIEFRYGEKYDELGYYSEGEYAFWLPAATLDGYEESLLKDCIKLYVDENMAELTEAPAEEAVPAT